MTQEIELKFIVNPAVLDSLRNTLNSLESQHSEPRQLLNIYYETADNQLRRHDMGLRIRGDNGRYEMTMKIAGRVTGGLHQRPEYNVELSKAELDLSLLPKEVWPEGLSPDDLQSQLNPLFSTDFAREKWVVTYGKSRIELALDLGEVKAGELSEPLCELELELLEGETADVLAFAKQLVAQPGLRQGSLSKAARGYHLVQGNMEREIKPLTVLRVPPKATVEQGLEGSLELALSHWQYHEELWLRGNGKAKAQVLEAVGLVRYALALFGGIIPRKASTQVRELVATYETMLASDLKAQELAFSAESSQAKLALTEWLVGRQWQKFTDEKANVKLAGSFKRFADTHLSRHAAELKETFQRPLGDSYADQLPRLARETGSIRLLAGVYEDAKTQPWLDNWQGLRHAIATRQQVEIEHYRNEAIAQAPFWLHSGK
ncbi:inorganic triphosphatase [Buttiauxella sp. A2-C1_F]|uniref:CYTH domain-containing protein n=1 Tax=unclassified Buttiauxella TaxID=2634062 RepID=UPI001E3C0553|nr:MULTISPECIES: inorganic triphosphatase [unclassified Buttiauxella]MCE0802228.1 inorganic triphosphatase [Buttiauxella sp. W03-F01]MCE0847764.1 inorganic triphosphatase [Buttiauxella sp. A2-C1_F]